jgi:hypothetical protein
MAAAEAAVREKWDMDATQSQPRRLAQG